ncbi:hypothetical protein EDD29_1192 [Actinocorallia herbida]|uniref:Lipoprotein n=1 Tax=Actinocorallia herbida TaxID=58109 RepID=A0A3N1CR56_9ACTN|nr:hypothetical protein [Actinocorallia herbida]ROO83685.1 hypothetical protein EDD29_1192 [Actinocorallia herbida]
MSKRALTLSLTGVVALAAVTTGVVANADDSAAPASATAAVSTKSAASSAPSAAEKKAADEAKKEKAEAKAKVLWSGTTTASYFWDDGSGVAGDTGAPASGKPMQKGMFASPSWPMNTKVKVTYKDRSVTGFVGDRGPGEPSHRGVMLDLDTYTFRYLYDGGKPSNVYSAGVDEGHLKGVKVEVLQWGSGAGTKGAWQPFGS